jgi:hypothetical protein
MGADAQDNALIDYIRSLSQSGAPTRNEAASKEPLVVGFGEL